MEAWRKSEMVAKLNTLNFAGKTVFVFGHCNATGEMIDYLAQISVHVTAILDNNEAKIGNAYKEVPIVEPAHILKFSNCMVLIANRFCEQMTEQLHNLGYKGEIVKVLEYNFFAECTPERIRKGTDILKKIRVLYPERHLVICPHNSLGDVYWAMSFLPSYTAKPCVVAVNSEGCHQVAEMFGQKSITVSNEEMDELTQAVISNKEQNCIVAHHDKVHTDSAIEYLNSHFISFIDFYKYRVFGLDESAEPVLPSCNLPFENTVGILQGKTLIISPYAKSVILLPNEFWLNVISEYKSKEFMVCTSVIGSEEPLEGTIPVSFPLNQAVKAVEYAGYFIGIRSGLCDVINSAVCNKTVVFPDCIYSTTKMKVADFFALPGWNFLNLKPI
ncbi:MAG: hypothetical protein FWC26_14800 [Fibromonadales bacterium]|nr:hypothetical protein [Fibromonadales bacterium]